MQKAYILLVILLSAVLLGRFAFVIYDFERWENGEEVSFSTRIISEPKRLGRATTFTANMPNGQKVFTRTTSNFELKYGDKVRIEGLVKTQKAEEHSNGISRLLKDFSSPIFIDYPKISAEEETSLFFKSTIPLREKIMQNFQESLPSSVSGLLLGIVFGIKTYIPDYFNESLRTAGVLHVVAASGMNVSMVGGFLAAFFVKILKRRYALIVSLLGIWFYAIFAGFESSIIRAAIMGSFAYSAQIIGRQYSGLYGLFLAGFLMLFISPMLIFDIGFQLSFLATLGIMQLGKFLIFPIPFVGEDLGVTVAAQLFTLPVLMSSFGAYSLVSIAANALVLWTVPLLMILGAGGAIAGLILPPLGRLFLYLCLPFLFYFEKVVVFFGSLPFKIETERLSWQFWAGYLLIILAIISFVSQSKKK